MIARITAAFALLLPACGFAHGDDQPLLDALNEEIAKAPVADLYLRRGELFRQHEEWEKADADFLAAGKLDPTLALVDFFRARLFVESAEAEKALPLIDRYLRREPDDIEGRLLRGDVLAALGRFADGAAEYATAIRPAWPPRPEFYLRWSQFLAANPHADSAAVLAVIDEGIQHAGPVFALMEQAINLELQRKNYAGAVARIDTMLAHSARRETWLVRKGAVLEKMGRVAEATSAYRDALAAIDQLPARFRETMPIEQITSEARSALGRLGVAAPSAPR